MVEKKILMWGQSQLPQKYLRKPRVRSNIELIVQYLIDTLYFNYTPSQYENRFFLEPTIFLVSIPARQRFYNLINFNSNLHSNFSSGVFTQKSLKRSKFFKKSFKNIQPTALLLEDRFAEVFAEPTLLISGNFNYEQYSFFSHILSLKFIHLSSFFFKKSYNKILKKKKRIKKKFFKTLSRSLV